MTYADGNLDPDLEWAQTCGGVKPVNVISIPPVLDNWISNRNTDMKKNKYLHRLTATQKDHILSQNKS